MIALVPIQYVTTHSHRHHADPETIARMDKSTPIFVGPFDSWLLLPEYRVPATNLRLIHPGETWFRRPGQRQEIHGNLA
jgi:L-ascorbate metabolism protein UlaG (beta-lactamase superfamily)